MSNAIPMIVRCAIGQQNADKTAAPIHDMTGRPEATVHNDTPFIATPQGEGVVDGHRVLGTLPGDTT